MTWEANMDLQPVLHHYKAVVYMCAYLSKAESECLVAMKQAVWDAFEKELNNYEQMKLVDSDYINKREWSIQECAYHILQGQQLRKTFSGVIFADSNMPEKRFRFCLGEDKISELPEDSKNIFKRNIVDPFLIPVVLLSFQDTTICHQILNIRKMITSQQKLMMK